MNLGLLIYLIGIIDGIAGIFLAIGLTLGIVFTIGFIIARANAHDYEDDNLFLKYGKKLSMIGVMFLFLFAVIPSSKTITAIYLIPKIAENKDVQEIPSKAMKALNLKLDEWVDDFKTVKSK